MPGADSAIFQNRPVAAACSRFHSTIELNQSPLKSNVAFISCRMSERS